MTAPVCDLDSIRCVNCHSHFRQAHPNIKEVITTGHFIKDAPDFNTRIITDCQHENASMLHKFEETINGNHIFRALVQGRHIVYAIDKNNRLIFLRAFRNFKEYEKFLTDKKQILKVIETK
jgi:hypothetical protein